MTDRCTGIPDAGIAACCHQHDRDYGIRGTVTRAEADRRLRQCIAGNGHPLRAWLIWAGLRLVGGWWWKQKPVNAALFDELTDRELEIVRAEALRRLRRQYALRRMAW